MLQFRPPIIVAIHSSFIHRNTIELTGVWLFRFTFGLLLIGLNIFVKKPVGLETMTVNLKTYLNKSFYHIQ